MKCYVLFVFMFVLLVISCDKNDNNQVTFPYSIKSQKLRVQQDIKVYVGGVEIIDKDVINRFLNENPKFPNPKRDELKETLLTFLNAEEVVVDGTDTLKVLVEGDKYTFFIRGEKIMSSKEYVHFMTGFGDYSKIKLYCASYKSAVNVPSSGSGFWETPGFVSKSIDPWTGNVIVGNYKSIGTTFRLWDKDNIANMGAKDTLAIKEYYWEFY